MALPDPPLGDGVITLRGFESSDVSTLVEISQDPEISRWTLVPSPYTAHDARAYLARVAEGLTAGTRASFAIVDADDARMLGTAGLMAIDHALSRAEIGYSLAARARGLGAASRAVQLLAAWAFGALGPSGASSCTSTRTTSHRRRSPREPRPIASPRPWYSVPRQHTSPTTSTSRARTTAQLSAAGSRRVAPTMPRTAPRLSRRLTSASRRRCRRRRAPRLPLAGEVHSRPYGAVL